MRFNPPVGRGSGERNGPALSPALSIRGDQRLPPQDPLAVPSNLVKAGVVLRSCFLGDCDPARSEIADQAGFPRHATAIRQREFTAGRICAAAAMRELEYAAHAVDVARDRSPVWPVGLVGSISHTSELAAAAVARTTSGVRAIGLDLEHASALEDDLIDEICVPREREWLAGQPAKRRGVLAKVIFCAKEAAYKCQYPLTGEMFGFETFGIDLSLDRGLFSARFLHAVGNFGRGDRLDGHIWIAANHFVALVISAQIPAMADA